jgi:hypothetical protein
MSKIFKNKLWIMALLLTVSITGCGGGDGGTPSTGAGSTGAVCSGAGCVSLGTAGDLSGAGSYVVLAETAITSTGTTAITGNVGISPNKAASIAGFGLIADATNVFSTSSLVTGKVYASDYAVPTPANLTAAVLSMQAAYTDAAGRAATSAATTNVGAGTLTSLTLTPGVYEWGTAVTIPTDLTLNGSATDVWIFKVAGTLDMAAAKNVILIGGALAQNIFWQVSGAVTIGAGSHFDGIILAQTGITLLTGASMNGRALAQSAVTLQGNAITAP